MCGSRVQHDPAFLYTCAFSGIIPAVMRPLYKKEYNA